jgi:DNA-binding beta-propeller fold protein YncE
MSRKPLAALGLVALVAGCANGHSSASPSATASARTGVTRQAGSQAPPPAQPPAAPTPVSIALGLPPVGPGPVPGYVLIADRNNNRLLIVSPSKRIVWRFPRPGDVKSGQSFHDPDDAFFTPGYRRIVTNEEFNDTIAQISIRRHRIVWAYGRAGVAGSGRGELSHPDDAYVLPSGDVMVADIQNCRVLRISPRGKIVGGIGSAGRCAHDPPRALLAPNGDTPLPDGGVLVTEIGGYVDRIDAHGQLVWSIRTPTTYPSDAQLLPNGNILVAGFNTPGRIDVLTPRGRVVWSYGPSSGPGSLDRPSLAVRWPNGMIAVTDDWHHRIVVIDPRTKRIVWQYGHLGVASSADGYLSKPDGLDLLPAQRTPATRKAAHREHLSVTRIGSLPAPASRIAATVLPGGRVLLLGGLVGGSSSDQILLGTPSALRPAGRLPAPTHDAAAAFAGGTAYLFGGGEAVSTDAVVRIDPRTGTARAAGKLGEPLSDLGAASVGGRIYLVGGYTGSRFATAVLRFRPGRAPVLVARLPKGLRYAGVAALGGRIYVAGGLTTTGESSAVYAVDPATHSVKAVATLPAPVAHAALAALGSALYLVGGRSASGKALDEILRIDPQTGKVSRAGRLPQALEDPAAVAQGGRIVVFGGAGSNAVLALRP